MNWIDWILDKKSIDTEDERKTIELFRMHVETLKLTDTTLNYDIYLNKINELLS